jgi:hypothetical protein
MQKIVFMNSMIEVSEMAVRIGCLASNITDDQEKSKKILSEAKNIFELSSKSLRAFFMVNDKEKFELTKFSGAIESKAKVLRTDEQLFSEIVSGARVLLLKVNTHLEVQHVFHDNGKKWKKTQVDKDRFFSISKSVEGIIALLS